MHTLLLRSSAIFLGAASAASLFLLDLPGIGFSEAYMVAFVVAMLLWRAYPVRYAQLTGAVVQIWLGVLNVLFWRSFVEAGLTAPGAILLCLHFTFAALQILAATAVDREKMAA